MMIPDFEPVAEVLLFIEGFQEAKRLSRKLVELYKLLGEQLSKSKHYDFGMRSIKSLLLMAAFKRHFYRDAEEEKILLAAICDCNFPKFTAADATLFKGLLVDIGFGVDDDLTALVSQSESEGAYLLQAMKAFDFDVSPDYFQKILQFQKTADIRFGILALGPIDCGKTSMVGLAMYSRTQDCLHSKHLYCINPKCLSAHELYGCFQPTTKEWQDGLSAKLFRDIHAGDAKCKHFQWVVFDGPIDALWIENMNTVLDDNECLCLANGERLQLSRSRMRIVFEVDEVFSASPATITRLGVVYVNEKLLSSFSVSIRFLKLNLKGHIWERFEDVILDLFRSKLPNAIDFVRAEGKENVSSTTTNLCLSCCHTFAAVLHSLQIFNSDSQIDSCSIDVYQSIKDVFFFSVIWSVGANGDLLSQDKFNVWIRSEWHDLSRFGRSDESVFDFFIDTQSCTIRHVREIVSPYVHHVQLPLDQFFVPTVDSVRYSYVVQLLLIYGRSLCINGNSGVGKSIILMKALMEMTDAHNISLCKLSFSLQISSSRAQQALENCLERSAKGTSHPSVGARLIYFVDDVNLPLHDQYGAQPPIEFLRQLVDKIDVQLDPSSTGYGGFYDRKFWKFYKVLNATLLTCCCPARAKMSGRFTKHLHLINIVSSSSSVLRTIFTAMLERHLRCFSVEVQCLCLTAVEASVHIHEQIAHELPPTPQKFHYVFNLRDLCRVYQGIFSIRSDDCPNSQTFIKLWIHETQRVYEDRFIEASDIKWFRDVLHQQLRSRFKIRWPYESIFDNPLMFGDFLKMDIPREQRKYILIGNAEDLPGVMQMYLDGYNVGASKTLDLVLFQEAIYHVSRLTRALRFPQGHVLLVGSNGCGKQSASRLAAFIMGFSLHHIESYRSYGIVQFCDALKNILLKAGISRQPVIFFLDDSNIVDPNALDIVNTLLISGDIQEIFSSVEKEKISAEISRTHHEALKQKNLDQLSYFLLNIKENLRLILSVSPHSNSFREKVRAFPSILNCCTLDWYLPWSKIALETVADGIFRASFSWLSNEPFLAAVISEQASLTTVCVKAHEYATYISEQFSVHITSSRYLPPKFFVDYLKLFLHLLHGLVKRIQSQKDRLVRGISKMNETTSAVEALRREIEDLKPILDSENNKNQDLLTKLMEEKVQANNARQVVEVETRQVEEQATKVSLIREDAQNDLNEALPVLDAAVKALNSLTRTDIVECKSFLKPPALVQVKSLYIVKRSSVRSLISANCPGCDGGCMYIAQRTNELGIFEKGEVYAVFGQFFSTFFF